MSESSQNVPHYYLEKEVTCNRLVELREKILSDVENHHKVHLTYTDFILKALAIALPANPLLNASWADGQVRLYKEVHLGLAIATQLGLMVGVIHQAEKLTLFEIAITREALAKRAKDGKLTTKDAADGTFTFTNLGMFGIDSFAPIINPPQSAILAVGALIDHAVAKNGKLVLRPTMKMTLAADHRVVDGVEGAVFMKMLSELIGEKPEKLID